ncbi:hypothetical protein QR680_002779 [Steinernema hermaphroditum]|uniref:Aldehyde dehydrogenase domain-containing protein n=1 Tax=Steinernema hermaphroditum TaxID=289476 RepID=A0AA39H4X9_9BILA|nr:hypothetical protein QR680_002779 [Steinernema hermaphroditum]
MGEVAELWPNLPGAELRPHFVRYKKPIHGHAAESDLRVLRELFKGGECSRLRPLRAPVLPIRSSANLSEPIAFINSGEKPLAAYIFTLLESRSTTMHITVDTLPFGGVGASGMGCHRGQFGFASFTHEKAVLKRGFFGEALL